MFAKMRILIENTQRSMAMSDGVTRRDGRPTFAAWAHTRFLAYD